MIDKKEENNLTDFKEIERMNSVSTEIEKELDEEWKEIKVAFENIEEELTIRQLKFIELYCWDMMGNWVQAYLDVYDIDTSKTWWYKTACAWASRLLSNVKVYTKINQMLEESWLNDNFIDKQLFFLISQQSDLSNKLWAIREYNKLKNRITEKMEVTWKISLLDLHKNNENK